MLKKLSSAILGLLLSVNVCAASEKTNIQVTDLLKMKQLRSIEISPDGTKAVYVVRSIQEKKEGKEDQSKEKKDSKTPDYEYKQQLWMISLDGSVFPRQLTFSDTGASEPVWNPDGKRLAFIRTVDKNSQIFILPLEGGEAWQLTKMEFGASSPQWSPNGKSILFSSEIPHHKIEGQGDKKKKPEWPVERPKRTPGDVANWYEKEGDKPKANPDGNIQEIREWLARNEADSNPRVMYRQDFEGELDLQPEMTYAHLFIVEVKPDAEPREITSDFYSYGNGQWMPGGKEILASSLIDSSQHPDRSLDSNLYLIPIDGSKPKLLLDLPDYSVFAGSPSPDGKSIAFVAQDLKDPGYQIPILGTIPVTGGKANLLTKELDREIDEYEWSQDSKSLYFVANFNGAFPLYKVSAAGGKEVRLTELNSGVRALDVGRTKLAYVLTEVANPYEIYTANLDGSAAKKLTTYNSEWLANKNISFPTAHKLTREDGTIVDYWIMKPANPEAGKKYPLLVEMHGGPSAMWGPGEDTTWHEFQMFCGKGYGIVYSNPRGSGGYGYKFLRGNFQNWGEGPGGDVLAAATEAAKESWVDPARQVLTGGSYAGYLTAWIVGHDHRFKAAVSQRGVYDLRTFMGEANAWRLVPFHMGGYPWQPEVKSIIERESPITYANEITTPLMIKHSDQDLRAGVIQSEMLYKYLKILGRPVEYVRYPDEGHELSRSGNPKHRIDRLLRIYEFFERYVSAPPR